MTWLGSALVEPRRWRSGGDRGASVKRWVQRRGDIYRGEEVGRGQEQPRFCRRSGGGGEREREVGFKNRILAISRAWVRGGVAHGVREVGDMRGEVGDVARRQGVSLSAPQERESDGGRTSGGGAGSKEDWGRRPKKEEKGRGKEKGKGKRISRDFFNTID